MSPAGFSGSCSSAITTPPMSQETLRGQAPSHPCSPATHRYVLGLLSAGSACSFKGTWYDRIPPRSTALSSISHPNPQPSLAEAFSTGHRGCPATVPIDAVTLAQVTAPVTARPASHLPPVSPPPLRALAPPGPQTNERSAPKCLPDGLPSRATWVWALQKTQPNREALGLLSNQGAVGREVEAGGHQVRPPWHSGLCPGPSLLQGRGGDHPLSQLPALRVFPLQTLGTALWQRQQDALRGRQVSQLTPPWAGKRAGVAGASAWSVGISETAGAEPRGRGPGLPRVTLGQGHR